MNILKSLGRLTTRRSLNKTIWVGMAALTVASLTAGPKGSTPPPPAPVPTVDLSPAGSTKGNVVGDVGGTAIFSDHFLQPTGTGVFQPFLDLKAPDNDKFESAYNTDGNLGTSNLYLDQHRQQWNNLLRFGDLAKFRIDNKDYFAFVLDANEPGNKQDPTYPGDASLISIDNFHVYTSSTINTGSVKDNENKLNLLGDLRWAMNNPARTGSSANDGYDIDKWVKLDSAQENLDIGETPSSNANGGSGMADMIVYVPALAFDGAKPNDYVWVYNLNGVHYAADVDLASTSGFEEWRAVVNPERTNVPDGGATIALFGMGLVGLGFMRRKVS